MKTFLKDSILAITAISIFFLSYGKEAVSMGTKTQEGTPDTRIWKQETAWSGGFNYVKKGDWATYTEYLPNNCVAIYAGESTYAGTAHFSRVDNGKVTVSITLADGWELNPGTESVKIQGYASAPKSKPAPDQFAHKGNSLVTVVDVSDYYGIHLDVRK